MFKKRKQTNGNSELGLMSQLGLTGLIVAAVGLGVYQSRADANLYDKVKPVPKSQQVDRVAVNKLIDFASDGAKYLGNGFISFLDKSAGYVPPTEAEIDASLQVNYNLDAHVEGFRDYSEPEEVPLEDLEDNSATDFPYDAHVNTALEHVEEIKRDYQVHETHRNADTINLLTEVAYAEARSLYGDYKFGRIPKKNFETYISDIVAASVINRTLDRKQSIEEVVTDGNGKVHAYSYRNKNDPNKKLVGNAYEHASKDAIELEAYHAIEEIVERTVENGTDSQVDHYFVRKSTDGPKTFPNWAFYNNGELRTPVMTMEHYLNGERMITRAYDID